MTDQDHDHLIGNIVSHLSNANKEIQIRQTKQFYKADPDYGRRVAEGLGIEL
jgi:catalase